MQRLDLFLVLKGLYASRAKAVSAIKEGLVLVNGMVAKKPSLLVNENDKISAGALSYVSGRGALKLKKALEEFSVNPHGLLCLDVGASTGGFTEVLLDYGAEKVVAVDVGTNQLIEEIKNNPKVLSFEQTDIRDLAPCFMVDLIVVDVSFISLTNIIDALLKWQPKSIIVLIKPQFEVPREIAARCSGVIKREEDRQFSINKVISAFQNAGYLNKGLIESPIRGGSGNIEYLALFAK